MRFFHNFLKIRSSILCHMMLSCFLIFAIPMLVFFGFLYNTSIQQANREAGERCIVSLRSLSNTIDEILRSGNSLQSQIQADPLFFDTSFSPDFLNENDDVKSFYTIRTISRTLYHYYLSNMYLSAIDLYNPYSDIIFSSKLYSTRKTFYSPNNEQLKDIRMPKEAKTGAWYIKPEENKIVSYSMPFSADEPSKSLDLRISFPLETLTIRYRRLFPSNEIGLMICYDGFSTPVLFANGMNFDQVRQEKEGWNIYTYHGQRYLYACFNSYYTGWNYYMWGPVNCFSLAQDIMNSYSGLFYPYIIVIFIILSLYLFRQIVLPIRKLSKAMSIAEQGNLKVRVELNRNDELGRIGNQFNVFLSNIANLIWENYETRMLKNDFELRYIQNQLKEHFLYNTLDTIHWIANANHVPQISEIIFNLSKFFRLTLNEGSDKITVHQSAEILKSYIMLINTRMNHSIDSQITVLPEIENKETYKYFFQPVVENAYQHGLRQKNGGKLLISFTKTDNGWLEYTVKDDGVGMPLEKLNTLREDINNPSKNLKISGHHFALKNIARQLHLYFQNDYRFTIDSWPDIGTTVVISFPIKEESSCVQLDDCR